MIDSNNASDELEVLLAFSVEAEHRPETLARYIESYPHLTNQLIDLSMDLELADSDSPVTDDLDAPELQAAWQQFSAMTSFHSPKLTADQIKQIDTSLVSMEMRGIGLPVSVLGAIKSGLVELEGFPDRWIERIASTGGYAVDLLRSYIARPPTLSLARSFKSDVKPQTGGKVTFRSLIKASTLTEAEQVEILRED